MYTESHFREVIYDFDMFSKSYFRAVKSFALSIQPIVLCTCVANKCMY